jgi:hypothetical protein
MNPTDQAIRENKAHYAALCKEADLEACQGVAHALGQRHGEHETQGVAHALGRKSLKPETTVSDSVKTLLQFLRE